MSFFTWRIFTRSSVIPTLSPDPKKRLKSNQFMRTSIKSCLWNKKNSLQPLKMDFHQLRTRCWCVLYGTIAKAGHTGHCCEHPAAGQGCIWCDDGHKCPGERGRRWGTGLSMPAAPEQSSRGLEMEERRALERCALEERSALWERRVTCIEENPKLQM